MEDEPRLNDGGVRRDTAKDGIQIYFARHMTVRPAYYVKPTRCFPRRKVNGIKAANFASVGFSMSCKTRVKPMNLWPGSTQTLKALITVRRCQILTSKM